MSVPTRPTAPSSPTGPDGPGNAEVIWSAIPPQVATMTRGSLIWPAIGLICLLQAVLALFRDGWTVALSVVWLLVAALAAAATARIWRSRVRLRPDGVEVRELRTTLYPWSALVAVYNDGSSRQLVLRFTDGEGERVAFLPVPFKPGLFRRRINPAFVDAPAQITDGWQRYAPLPAEPTEAAEPVEPTEAAGTSESPEVSEPSTGPAGQGRPEIR